MADSSIPAKQHPTSAPPTPQPAPSTPAEPLKIKIESQEFPNQQPPRTPPSEPIAQPAPDPEVILKSVTQLGGLSAAIHAFKCRFDELQNHLNFIDKSIDARFNDLTGSSSSLERPPMVTVNQDAASIEDLAPVKLELGMESQSGKINDSELKLPADIGNGNASKEQPERMLENLCQMMCSRGLRKHLMCRLTDIPKLREEVPAALKLAPNPAKLVFECIGRFFLQGRRAYTKDSPMIAARQASVLILEFFLLMMGDFANGEVEIEPSIKQDAEAAARSWRNRLITEGGVRSACQIDARGLLLFIACFGIPAEFKNEDLRYLIVLSNASEISEALRRSRVLVPRIPDTIEVMLTHKFYVEAVDVAYTFGIEDKYPPQTHLTSFLRESKEASKKLRKDAPPPELKEAKQKQLDGLKSVIKCLEDHKVDPAKILPGWQVKDRIISLEKEIAELDKKISDKGALAQKRKTNGTESSNRFKSHETKRSRFATNGSHLVSQPIIGLHRPRAGTYAVRSYNGLMSTNYLDNGLSSSFSQDGSSLPGVGMSAGIGAHSAGIGAHSPGLYAGIHGQGVVDNAGQVMNEKVPSYMWRGSGSSVFGDRSVGRSYAGHHASVGTDGLPQSVEGLGGVPNHPSVDIAKTSADSELYRFADAVGEGESHRSSGSQVTESQYPGVPAHLLSYMY